MAILLFAASIANADITVNGKSYSSGVGLNTENGTFTITGAASGYVQVKQNCTIVLDNVTWTASEKKQSLVNITDGKTVTLMLRGKNTMSYNSYSYMNGIYVGATSTLSITNLTEDASLIITATGVRSTAIGGSYNANTSASACGTVNIWGGAISAKSGYYSAGIGGYCAAGGTVNIHGGTVVATGTASGSTDGGAGIGGGYQGAGGTVNIYGGTVKATGGARGAGIGGGNKGAGGTVRIYGGCVTATGGERAAGIGGGNNGAGGAFYNYGGTVWATAGRSDSAYESDIGKGMSGSTGTFVANGGSTKPANGKIDATMKNASGANVYRVVLDGLTSGRKYTFAGLSDNLSYTYGQDSLIADSSGQIHLMLPPAEHVFTFEEDGKRYQFTTANATGRQTLSPVEIAPEEAQGKALVIRFF